jgi:hypothetical protein
MASILKSEQKARQAFELDQFQIYQNFSRADARYYAEYRVLQTSRHNAHTYQGYLAIAPTP